ncbi:MAG: zinc-binding dehydrogenase [Planctomycetota bacterium]|nr:MAG: zinc-binding dehydrogenase [Planctomycetota bacterium]
MDGNRTTKMMPALVYDLNAVRWTVCKVAGWVVPKVFWSNFSNLRPRSVPVPSLPSEHWVRLKTVLGGICGTDMMSIMQRQHPASILQVFSSFPAVLGHENVAVVEEAGSKVDQWQPGDRVVVEPTLSCATREIKPICPQCKAGHFTLCSNFRTGPLPVGYMIGWNSFTGGSWAPYFVAHESQLYRVPDEISDEEAVLVDPMAGALHAVLRYKPADNDTVLILGAGVLGMGVAAAIRALSGKCRLWALDFDHRQLEKMQRFGVEEMICVDHADPQSRRYKKVAERVNGRVIPSKFGHQAFIGGFDVVYDCVGTGKSLTDALKYAAPRSTVVEVGTSQITLVDTAPLWFDELNLIGANGRAIEKYGRKKMHTYEIVFELIKQGKLDLTGLLTHRFGIEQYREAFEVLVNRNKSKAIKVAFTHE